jgi:hypothetical protein
MLTKGALEALITNILELREAHEVNRRKRVVFRFSGAARVLFRARLRESDCRFPYILKFRPHIVTSPDKHIVKQTLNEHIVNISWTNEQTYRETYRDLCHIVSKKVPGFAHQCLILGALYPS